MDIVKVHTFSFHLTLWKWSFIDFCSIKGRKCSTNQIDDEVFAIFVMCKHAVFVSQSMSCVHVWIQILAQIIKEWHNHYLTECIKKDLMSINCSEYQFQRTNHFDLRWNKMFIFYLLFYTDRTIYWTLGITLPHE